MAETPAPQKGVLPKNLQTWVLLGVTIVVIAVILAGSRQEQERHRPVASAAPRPLPAPPINTPRLQQLTADAERAQREALAARIAGGCPRPSLSPGHRARGRTAEAKGWRVLLFASQLARSYRARSPRSLPRRTHGIDAPRPTASVVGRQWSSTRIRSLPS
jgi:hypothetical protein